MVYFFQVKALGSRIKQILDKIGTIALDNLPPFIKKVKAFIDAVNNLYEKVEEDVMTFYNVWFCITKTF